jgi:transcriptional regulator with XRE-family HTH domain
VTESTNLSLKLVVDRIAEFTKPHGMLAEFCRESKLARRNVENWLNGTAIPLSAVDQIAKGLGTTPSALLNPKVNISLTPLIRKAISLIEQMDDNTRRDALQTLEMYALASKHRNEKIEGSGSSG